jgi:cell wall-associated NlpC family hydrolase
MTQLASRAVLSAIVLAALALVLATAVLSRPETAAADAPRAEPANAEHTRVREHGHAVKHAQAKKRGVDKQARKHVRAKVRKRVVGRGQRAVQIANRLTGVPYVWGGASPRSGFDCSGLVQYVYGKLGISLPHYTVSQYGRGRAVSRSSLRPGDLVFFYGLNHVGIYAGGGKYIHAPRSGTTVRWSSLAAHGGYYGARRIVAS